MVKAQLSRAPPCLCWSHRMFLYSKFQVSLRAASYNVLCITNLQHPFYA